MNSKSFFVKYKSIIAFLILEILALVSFTFANINEVLFLISTALTIAAFLFAFFTNVNKRDYLKLFPVLALLFIISGIASFGGFSNSFSTLSNIATFFAIPSFFALGFFARRLNEIKTENYLLAIGFGLAAIVLVSTFITWIQYGPFFSLVNKVNGATVYYYDGATYDITKEMGWLVGFKVAEVSQDYGGLFASLCAIFLPSLFFINRKENRNLFISVLIIGTIGLVSILSVPNFKALIFVAVASLFAFAYKFLSAKKTICKGLFISVICVVGLGVLFYVLSIVNAAAGFAFPGFLNKLFVTNRFMRAPSSVLSAIFAKDINGYPFNLFGFDLSNVSSPIFELSSIVQTNTHIFEYEILKEVGIIGSIFVLGFFAIMFVFTTRYLKDSKDNAMIKSAIIMFLVVFALYCSFGFDIKPQTHNYQAYQAFLRSVPFMISLFVMGFIYFVPKAENDTNKEKVEEASL